MVRVWLLALLLAAGCAAGQVASTDGSAADGSTDDRSAADWTVEPPPIDSATDISGPGDGPTTDVKPPGTITVTAPAGGESWPAGSAQVISWSWTGSVGAVDIELWKAGTKHSDVAQGQTGGTNSWTVPASIPGGSDYTVRIVDPQTGVTGTSAAPFSILNWQYRVTVTVTSPTALSGYQVPVALDSTFAYAHAQSGGADLRAASSPTLTGSFDLPHWIGVWKPNGASTVWVRLPSIPAGQPTKIYLFYGRSDVLPASNLLQTFPNRFLTTGDLSLGGSQSYDWFELRPGHTLSLVANQALTIKARRILILGTVDGTGKGHPGGTTGSTGQGPGGGTGAIDSGGGGGSYGGVGGTGGYDSGDSPGSGGATYGSASTTSVEAGSGGGGGNVSGGAGGGTLSLSAHDVQVSGTIKLNGAAGAGGAQSGGGGAGGGLLIQGHDVNLSGTCSVKGGAGGSGSSSVNDGGGGGGGGRIKLFYGGSLATDGQLLTDGGAGGVYGDAANGTAGAAGTSYNTQQSFSTLTVTVGPEQGTGSVP